MSEEDTHPARDTAADTTPAAAVPPRETPVELVTFDLDDTICEYPVSYERHLLEAFERTGHAPFFDATDVRRAATGVEAEDPLDFREQAYTAAARANDADPQAALEVARAFDGADPETVVLRDGAAAAVRSLADRFRLAVVTNTTPAAMETKLETVGLTDVFEVCVAPGQAHSPKPAPDMFEHVLTTLDVDPDRTVHVGNSTVSDVAGAHAAGIRSVWVPTERDAGRGPAPTWTVEDATALQDPPWPEGAGDGRAAEAGAIGETDARSE